MYRDTKIASKLYNSEYNCVSDHYVNENTF